MKQEVVAWKNYNLRTTTDQQRFIFVIIIFKIIKSYKFIASLKQMWYHIHTT
jgi:hypothetical protein